MAFGSFCQILSPVQIFSFLQAKGNKFCPSDQAVFSKISGDTQSKYFLWLICLKIEEQIICIEKHWWHNRYNVMCSRCFDRLDCEGLERHERISVQNLVMFIIVKSKLPPLFSCFPFLGLSTKRLMNLISYLEIKVTLKRWKQWIWAHL